MSVYKLVCNLEAFSIFNYITKTLYTHWIKLAKLKLNYNKYIIDCYLQQNYKNYLILCYEVYKRNNKNK